MRKLTCDACGHVNPQGTSICSECGKPLQIDSNDIESNKSLLNMRYDGSAVRSKTHNKSIVDKIWNFFSSVKIGVTLIVITLIASAVGTILPQEMYIPPNVQPADHYKDEYGIFGQIYYQLGFHNLYSSWWYMILIALIGISIFIVSIDRGVPLYRALTNQKPTRHESFLKRQKLFSETDFVSQDDQENIIFSLKKHRYKVREENGHILAEKGRFSRWGPYVNHLGLIIFLFGSLLRFIPFMHIDDFVWIREGDTVVIPKTDGEYYVKNENFILETYDEEDERFSEAIKNKGMVASNYQTDVVIYKSTGTQLIGQDPDLAEIKQGSIRVNHPIKFDGYALYQSSYQQNEFSSISFKIHKAEDKDEKALANFTVDLTKPQSLYELENGYRVEIDQYFPEYFLDEGVPRSKSKYPRNPAFVFFVYPPNQGEPEISFAGIGRNVSSGEGNEYKVGLTGFEMRDVTGLSVKRDYTLPILGLGAAIFMIGVIQGMYWQHRRIWLHPKGNGLMIAAHTNKNWYGLKNEFAKIIADTEINMVIDQEQEDD
ncbi:cytochrome c biogenesis protein ResB [Aquibacillus kalidii]|uniref:cytochrome c biogenesis protein ResB n=1 Tax=Aquibacillus kalidii TaxID=2762597 RepID=UPI001644697A|nr:cytochrome c biogenesis protein ResB [Aquibacillus kalidii]